MVESVAIHDVRVKGNILVTGGLGFIGSHIVDSLGGNSDNVIVYDIMARSEDPRANVIAVNGDISAVDSMVDVMREYDVNAVVHMVGLASISACRRNPDLSFRLNVASVHNILEAMRLTGVDRLVFPSTAAVYGVVENPEVDEGAGTNPVNIYGFHKLSAENLIRGYDEKYDFNSTILRLFNVYGDLEREQGVISIFIKKAQKGEALIVNGGDQLRDFVSVDDVTNVFVRALENSSTYHRTVNVGSGVGVSVGEVAEIMKKCFASVKIIYAPPKIKEYSIYADNSLLRSLLKIDISHPRMGIPDFVESCKSEVPCW